jgi:hypothetical protein
MFYDDSLMIQIIEPETHFSFVDAIISNNRKVNNNNNIETLPLIFHLGLTFEITSSVLANITKFATCIGVELKFVNLNVTNPIFSGLERNFMELRSLVANF